MDLDGCEDCFEVVLLKEELKVIQATVFLIFLFSFHDFPCFSKQALLTPFNVSP
jgi:hypothetical protein